MASNVVIARAGAGKTGAVGALEAACVDYGSIKEVTLTSKGTTYSATQANRASQVVEKSKGPTTYTLGIVLEEITAANFAAGLDAIVDHDGEIGVCSSNDEMEYWCGYFHGFVIDGVARTLHILKASVVPDSSVKIGTDGAQQLIQLNYELMADVDSVLEDADGNIIDVLHFPIDSADTTPPTISSVSPADGATDVAKAVTTLVVWTFSEAIRTEDVTAERFFVHADDGSIKAGTLSIGTNNTVVTLTPTTAWGATTTYHPCAVKGARDVAGNKLAATSVTDFTTGS